MTPQEEIAYLRHLLALAQKAFRIHKAAERETPWQEIDSYFDAMALNTQKPEPEDDIPM